MLNSDGVSTRHPVEQTRARDSARVTANPEVISSLVELVPTNALVVTELSMFIDRPETGFARDLTQDFKVSSMPQMSPCSEPWFESIGETTSQSLNSRTVFRI